MGILISAHHASRSSSAIAYLCEVFQRSVFFGVGETHVLVLVRIWRMVPDCGTVLAYHAVRYVASLRPLQHGQVTRNQTSAVLHCHRCILAVRHAASRQCIASVLGGWT